MRPKKYRKFPLFGKGRLPRPISKILGAFIGANIMHQWFKFDVITFTGYAIIAEKPHVDQLGRIFPSTL